MRTALTREQFTRALMLWLFSPATFAERPEFVEAVVQNSLANPYPPSTAGFARQSEAVGSHDTLARLGRIRCPTLITVGAEDILVPPRFSRQIHERIPHAEFGVLDGVGHGHFLEAPERFNETSLGFLARHASAVT